MLKRVNFREKYNDRSLITSLYTDLDRNVIETLYTMWQERINYQKFEMPFIDYLKQKHKDCFICPVEHLESFDLFVE